MKIAIQIRVSILNKIRLLEIEISRKNLEVNINVLMFDIYLGVWKECHHFLRGPLEFKITQVPRYPTNTFSYIFERNIYI
jgi:hypothetical protein